jgi:DNA-directed RNA polymerase specialized sigma24 family protein
VTPLFRELHIIEGDIVHAEQFDKLYVDSSLRKRIRSLAYRYFRAYSHKWDVFGWDVEDLEQELWIRIYEGENTNHDLIISAAVADIHNLLRDSEADVRAVDEIDLWELAYEDDEGNLESNEDVMDRLVFRGKAQYI